MSGPWATAREQSATGVLRLASWRAIALIAPVYSICFGFLASSLRVAFGFPLDDSYITQTIARNLAQTGVLGYYAGKPSPGATSLLWVYIQAANFQFLHLDPVIFNLVLSWLFPVVIGVLLYSIGVRDGLSPWWSLTLAIAPAFCGNFLWLGLIGMEHLLFVLLVLSAVHFCLESGTSSALLTGAAVGLLAITRPGAIPLGLLLLSSSWLLGRKAREFFIALALWLVFVVLDLAANLSASHSFMPGTLNGRTWLYFHGSGGPHSFISVLSFVVRSALRPSMNFSLWYAHADPVSYAHLLLVLGILALDIAGALWLLNHRLLGFSLLIALTFLHFCIFAAMLPSSGQGARYQPLNLLLVVPCMFIGVFLLLRRMLKGYPQIMRVSTVVTLGLASLASLCTWRTVAIEGIAHINNTHGEASRWLAEHAAHSRVAAFDFGRISYDAKGEVLDIGGLTDPSFYTYMNAGRVPDYVREKHVDLVVLPNGEIPVYLGFSNQFPKRVEFCTPRDAWSIPWSYTWNAAQCQAIYQVH